MGRVPALPDLYDILNDHKRRLRALETGTPLKSASIGRGAVRFSDTGIILGKDATIQSEDWDGDLGTRDAGENGWAVSRVLAAFADFVVRPGSIGNDLLTSPVDPISSYDYVTNFAVTTTLTNIRTKTIPVPAGFTKAAVALTVRVYATNNSAGLDYLYAQANINGFNGLALPVAATNGNGSAMNVSTFSAVLDGANLGSNLVLQIAAQTAFGAWSSDPVNAADLSASVAWYR